MKVIKYISLFRYLTHTEGLKASEAYRNIQRIRKLPNELKEAVYDVLSSVSPNVSYEGVSFRELTDVEGMKPIRAILMLDWIRREPVAAMQYMATERLRHSLFIKVVAEEKGVDEGDESDIEF